MMANKQTDTAASRFSRDERRATIRKFRKQLKLSQTEFAALAGIGPSMLSRFENGERDLSAEAMSRVEKAIADSLAERQDRLKGAGKLVPMTALMHPSAKALRGVNVEAVRAYKELGRQDEQIERMRRQIEAYEKVIAADAEIIAALKESIAALEKEITRLKAQVKDSQLVASR